LRLLRSLILKFQQFEQRLCRFVEALSPRLAIGRQQLILEIIALHFNFPTWFVYVSFRCVNEQLTVGALERGYAYLAGSTTTSATALVAFKPPNRSLSDVYLKLALT
jgi:hypothetical protein